MGDKSIFSSERMLQKDYGCTVAKEKKKRKESLVMSLKGLGTKMNQLVGNRRL
jgi:hypothetical protein